MKRVLHILQLARLRAADKTSEIESENGGVIKTDESGNLRKIIKNPLTKSAERNILWNVDVSTPH